MRTCPTVLAIVAVAGAACSQEAAARDEATAPVVGVVNDPCHRSLPQLHVPAGSPDAVAAPATASSAPAVDGATRREAPVDLVVRDWVNLCRYHDDNQALIASGRRVQGVFIGDSITEGWGALGPGLFAEGMVNRGISGQTSSQMLLRFMADVVALRPRFVHILAGTNDVAGNAGPLRIEDYQNNVMAMAEIARAHGIRVIIGAIPPADHFDWRPGIDPRQPIAELNAWLRAYATHNDLYFVDYHSALADSSGRLPPEFANDGVHPNAKAYGLMRALAAPAMKRALGQ